MSTSGEITLQAMRRVVREIELLHFNACGDACRWLFMIEGLITMLFGVALYVRHPKPTCVITLPLPLICMIQGLIATLFSIAFYVRHPMPLCVTLASHLHHRGAYRDALQPFNAILNTRSWRLRRQSVLSTGTSVHAAQACNLLRSLRDG